MKEAFPGIIHGLGDLAGVTGEVIPRGNELEIRFKKATLGSLPYAGMRISSTGVNDKFLCFETDMDERTARVLVPDREIIERMVAVGAHRVVLEQLKRVAATRSKRKAGRVGVLVGAVATIGILGGLLWLGLVWATQAAVDLIPTGFEVELGKATATDILAASKTCADPELNRAVGEMAFRLVGEIGITPYAFKFRVLDAEEVNAFALPGGYVFINRGLIEKSNDSAEVAGVVAHEVAHVIHRHGLNNLVRQASLLLVVAVVFGDLGGLEQFLMYNAASLAGMSFSREQERKADAVGLNLMYKSNLDAMGLPRFLHKLSTEEHNLGPLLTMLSTHPATENRIRRLHQSIASRPTQKTTPIRGDWGRIKRLCTPVQIDDPDAL